MHPDSNLMHTSGPDSANLVVSDEERMVSLIRTNTTLYVE